MVLWEAPAPPARDWPWSSQSCLCFCFRETVDYTALCGKSRAVRPIDAGASHEFNRLYRWHWRSAALFKLESGTKRRPIQNLGSLREIDDHPPGDLCRKLRA